MQSYTVVCDGEPIGSVTLPPANADEYTTGDLDAFPAFERVRLILCNGKRATWEADDLITEARQAGNFPTFEPPTTPEESSLQLDAINASFLAVVGRDRVEAIEAAEALRFGLLDDSGRSVPGVGVSLSGWDWPVDETRSRRPLSVMVVSGSWVQKSSVSNQNTSRSRPEA
jgi:hypothetical protein